MASTKEQFDFILEQLSGPDEVSFRALYPYTKAGRKGSLGLPSDLKENF
ncbi:hypothetical protein GCWU000341_00512 [Oribacterium sp. oral taxon 078 str. F0262]|nr:hypothetical protein [Oribacterium sp. oral taxon 078]EFE92627.1 hypothetical protein GCWU000341_00512 [Oribacterium sp. oral taxon 078 str. F0262]